MMIYLVYPSKARLVQQLKINQCNSHIGQLNDKIIGVSQNMQKKTFD